MRHSPFRWLTAAALLVLASCGLPTDGCSCEAASYHAIVFGTVFDSLGAPVARAPVQVSFEPAGCPSDGSWGIGDGSAISGEDGSYRLDVRSPICWRRG